MAGVFPQGVHNMVMDYSIMWFGFRGQNHALGFGQGRFRKSGECLNYYETKCNIADVSDTYYGTRRVVAIPAQEQETTIAHANRMRQHLISQFQWEVIA